MEKPSGDKKRLALRKEVLSLAVTIFALAAALVFAFNGAKGYGWFASNDSAEANGMNARIQAESIYELARTLPGTAHPVPYSSDAVFTGFLAEKSVNYNYGLDMTNAENGISFTIGIDNPNSASPSQIFPGAHGKIEFYVITGESSLSIDFNTIEKGYASGVFNGTLRNGFMEDLITSAMIAEASSSGTVYAELVRQQTAFSFTAQLIKGHILVFDGYSEEHGYENIINGRYSFDSSSMSPVAEINGKKWYKITLYWIWPKNFGQMFIMDQADPRLKGESPLFYGTATGAYDPEAKRNALAAIIAGNPGRFFYDPNGTVSYGTLAADLAALGTNFTELSKGYNSADEMIGERADYLVVEFNPDGI